MVLTSREFNQDTARAKREATGGPVFITDRGEPSHVLLTFEEYRRLTAGAPTIGDLLADPSSADIDFDPPRLQSVSKPFEFD